MKKAVIVILLHAMTFFTSCENGNVRKLNEKSNYNTTAGIYIPFSDTLSSNHIILKATVNNKPAYLLLDNGTMPNEYLILFKPFAARAQIIDTLKPFRIEADRIANSSVLLSLSGLEDSIKNTVIKQLHMLTAQKNVPDGILGMGFLKRYIVEINYEMRYLQLHDTASYKVPNKYKEVTFKPPYTGPFRQLDAEFCIGHKSIKESISIDIGLGVDGFFFGLPKYLKYQHMLQSSLNGNISESYFVFSKSKNMNIVIDSVHIAGKTVKHIPATVEIESSASYDAILFGNNVLQRFKKVYFNFAANKIYLPENEIGNN
jgi:hypothetical protein